MELEQECIDAVAALNGEFFENGWWEDRLSVFAFSSDGVSSAIEFFGQCIWQEDDDSREVINEDTEEREPMEAYLRKQVFEYFDKLSVVVDAMRKVH